MILYASIKFMALIQVRALRWKANTLVMAEVVKQQVLIAERYDKSHRNFVILIPLSIDSQIFVLFISQILKSNYLR